jgi:hypothetical protein
MEHKPRVGGTRVKKLANWMKGPFETRILALDILACKDI